MRISDTFARVLSLPACYRFFRRSVGGGHVWRKYLEHYVKPATGEKVLDVGCGPADALLHLPKVDYTGIDISPEYIAAAKRRFDGRGRFLCHDVGSFILGSDEGSFDLVLATGVVHHLDDEQADGLLTLARRALRPHGRLVTFDGCYVTGQSPIARWMLRMDRGRFVRTQRDYVRMVSPLFSKVELHLRHDLLRIPYTHLIMCCSN